MFLTLTLRANEIDQLPKCKFDKGKLVTTELCKEEKNLKKLDLGMKKNSLVKKNIIKNLKK